VQGLCAEGRWEAAVGTLKTVELTPIFLGVGSDPAKSPLIRKLRSKILCFPSLAPHFYL
jgi:hypothetical protein